MSRCGAVDPDSGAVCTELPNHGLRHYDRRWPDCVVSWGEPDRRAGPDEAAIKPR